MNEDASKHLSKGSDSIDRSPRGLIKKLEDAGYVFVRQNSSHKMYKNSAGNLIPVPVHGNKDIPKGTYDSILKSAGLK